MEKLEVDIRAVFDGESGGFDLPQEVADPP